MTPGWLTDAVESAFGDRTDRQERSGEPDDERRRDVERAVYEALRRDAGRLP